MKSRFHVLLNDVSLESLNENIAVTDIAYPPSATEYAVANFAGRSGGMAVRNHKRELTVTVTFELHEYGTQQRQNACQEIIAWAKNGGKLQTSDRPDQYLQCVCTKPPSLESASKWTDALTVEFTAYTIPYWQGLYPSKLTISGASAEGVIFVPGNGETRPNVKITAHAAITTLTVTFGSTSIALTGLETAADDVITIDHDENGILSIKSGNTSLLAKRSVTSSDDLVAECGNIPVSVSASGSVDAEFTVRGVWD